MKNKNDDQTPRPATALVRKDVDITPFVGENHKKLELMVSGYISSMKKIKDPENLPEIIRESIKKYPLLDDPFPELLRGTTTAFYQAFQDKAEKGLGNCFGLAEKVTFDDLYNKLHCIEDGMKILLTDPDIEKGIGRLDKLKNAGVIGDKLHNLVMAFVGPDVTVDYEAVKAAIDFGIADMEAEGEEKRFAEEWERDLRKEPESGEKAG
jgi:hypothetical protein